MSQNTLNLVLVHETSPTCIYSLLFTDSLLFFLQYTGLRTLTSLFDCIVFFAIMKIVMRKIVLACYGEDSRKWKDAVDGEVQENVLLNADYPQFDIFL